MPLSESERARFDVITRSVKVTARQRRLAAKLDKPHATRTARWPFRRRATPVARKRPRRLRLVAWAERRMAARFAAG